MRLHDADATVAAACTSAPAATGQMEIKIA